MDLVSGYKGVVGRVFGGGNNSTSNEDMSFVLCSLNTYVERLLDRISNSSLVEDRRAAITDLQSAVAESQAGQLAFGTMGFPVLFGVLKEERDDIEMVRGVLETLVSALTPIGHLKVTNNEIKPALMNADLLSREAESISLLLSLLSDEDFYIRYYTLQVLTALLTNTTNRLQEAILTIPRGITRLMDMLMDRGVIRNEALLLLTYLTRDAEEIQKIVVFEGAFEKIFSIINEEGGSEGGVVVQDCLELLRNLLRDNISNQKFLSETIGFDPLISILKHRGSAYSFTQQKTINILSALETVNLLIMERSEVEPRKGSGGLNNKTVLVQKNLMYHLLTLGVESQWAPVAVRCLALKCIGDLISGHSKNIETLANKLLGEEPRVEPAINSIFRIILRTSSRHEFVEADYIFKCFCEKNREGQAMLAVALSPQLHTVNHLNIPLDEDANVSFGSLLLRGITLCDSDGDLETCCKAACVLSHILKDNLECKEKVLQIEVEAPTPSLGSPEPLMHRVMKYLALASSMNNKESKASSRWNLYVEPIILKLLITWLANFPGAVHCLLGSRSNLTYLLELVLNSSTTVYVKGLAAIVLGECILFNETGNDGRDASTIVDAISQKVGLTTYFSIFDKMQQSLVAKSPQSRKPLTRSNTASMIEIEDVEESNTTEQKNEDDPVLLSIFDTQFIDLAKRLEADIRESIVNVYSHSKSEVVVVTADLEQRRGENGEEYIKRLKSIVVEQGSEIQDLLARNSTLAEDLANAGGRSYSQPEKSERYQIEKLRRELQDASQQLENLKLEKANIESEASMYQNLAQKMDSDLQSLSEAYNSLEQANYLLENEMRAMKSVGTTPLSDIEEIKAEAEKESEAELNDLLICLGQEQSKVERLTSRLLELGEDVEKLLEGIGDDMEMPEFAEEEED